MYRSRTSAKTPKRKPVKKDKKKKKRKTKTPKVSVRQAQKQDVRQSVKVVVEAPKPRRKKGTLQPRTSSIQYQQQRPQLTQIINERQAFNNDFQDVLNIRLAAQERGITQISNNLGDLERRLNPNINTQLLTPHNAVPLPDVVTAMPDPDQFISQQPTPQQRIPQREPVVEIETPSGFVPLDQLFSQQKKGGFMEGFPDRDEPPSTLRQFTEFMSRQEPSPLIKPQEPLEIPSSLDEAQAAMDIMSEAMRSRSPGVPAFSSPPPEPPPEPLEEKEAEIQLVGTLERDQASIGSGQVATYKNMIKFLAKNNVKTDGRRTIDNINNRIYAEKIMINKLGLNAKGEFSEEEYYKK